MKLTLTNFGCWEKKIIEFPEKGNVLISAPSGKGKTTILRAIQFCLFGIGKKVIRTGCTSCMVEMEYVTNGCVWLITRSKPNKLTLRIGEDVYEASEAENRIRDIFPSSSLIISEQNKANHFLSMTNADQFDYLEKLVFQHFDYATLKENIKEKQKGVSDEIRNQEQLLERAQRQQHALVIPSKVNEIEKPDGTEYKGLVDEYNMLMKLSTIPQTMLTQRRDAVTDSLSRMKKITSNEIDQLNQSIRDARKWKAYLQLEDEYNEQKEHYDESIEMERSSIEEKRKNLYRPETPIEECLKEKKRLEKWNHIYETDKTLQDRQEEILHISRQITSDVVYKCPQCEARLHTTSSHELIFHLDIDKTIDQHELKERLSILEHEQMRYTHRLERLNECPHRVEELGDRLKSVTLSVQQHETYQTLFSRLQTEEKEITSKYASFYKRLTELYKRYTEMECDEPAIELEELEEKLQEARRIFDQRCRLREELATINEQLAPLETVTDVVNIEERLHELNRLKEAYTRDIELFYQYMAYKEKLDQYHLLVKEIEEYNRNFTELKSRLYTIDLFKKHVMKAETIALNTLIQTLNIHVQEYVDAFFENELMTIELMITRGEKSGRYQIRLELNYKNMQPTLEMLSGGEMDRLILAFTMGLNKLNACPIVLLDESVSSLDHQTAETVHEYLRKEGEHKLIIMIAHQVIEGQFDKIISF